MPDNVAPAITQPLSVRTAQPAASMSSAIVFLLALAVLINYVDRSNLATAAPLIQDELHLNNRQIGLLLSAFFWSYTPAQLLAGWLAHRLDVRYVLALGLVVWSLATMATGLVGGFIAILLLRLLLGLGESAFFPCNARLIAQYAPEHQRGRANGFVVTGQALGPTLGTLLGGVLMARYGWRAVFLVFGLVSLSWLWPWLRVSRRRLSTAAGAQSALQSISYSRVLSQRAAWVCGLGSFLSFYGYYLMLTWLPLYLVKSRGFTVTQMAQLGALVYGMHAISSPLVGWISDRWIRHGASPDRVRKTMLVVGSLTVAVSMLLCNHAGQTVCLALLLVMGFFFGFVNPQIFAIAQTLGGPRAAGKWMALQNMLGNVAGILAPLFTGMLVDFTGGYSWAFGVAAATAVCAALTWSLALRRIEAVDWDASPAR